MKLTAARHRGLMALLGAERDGRQARVSNVTDTRRGYVYWQTADWLVREGLAAEARPRGQHFDAPNGALRLTDEGRRVAIEEEQ